MNRKISKILVLILAFAIALSAAGCNLFAGEVLTNNPVPVYVTNLPDSKDLEDNVDMPTDGALTSQEKLAAVKKVKRSAVAIKMDNDGAVSYGSGVIVDIDLKDGSGNQVETDDEFYIITCHHVIAAMGNIIVYVPDLNGRNVGDENYDEKFVFTGVIDNKMHDGNDITLVGGDKETDVAVLKLDLRNNNDVTKEDIVECQVPDDSYIPEQGEDVFAVGNPSGILPMTVSLGVISYIDRAVTVSSIGDMTLMQIDVQTNHGSSGGGLYNYRGQLIGITNSGSDDYDGLNYAIPHKNYHVEDNGFITIAKQLIATKTKDNYGYISGRWNLGVTVKEQKNDNGDAYLTVESVEKASNADSAGIQKGDVIRTINYNGANGPVKVDITGNSSLASALYEIRKTHKLGDSFNITVYRKVGTEYTPYNLKLQLLKEYIFGDTGVYPEAE